MRNEDGMSWLMDGGKCWSDIYDAGQFSMEQFQEITDNVAESRRNDCPDNGFFGIYNLTYHEGRVPPMKTQDVIDAEAEWERMFEEQFGTWEPEPDPSPSRTEIEGIAKLYPQPHDTMTFDELEGYVANMPPVRKTDTSDILARMFADMSKEF